jgi:hypothetical protein
MTKTMIYLKITLPKRKFSNEKGVQLTAVHLPPFLVIEIGGLTDHNCLKPNQKFLRTVVRQIFLIAASQHLLQIGIPPTMHH